MKAIVELKDDINSEIINVDNVLCKTSFVYRDVDNIEHFVNVFDDGLIINRKDVDHNTTLNIRASIDSYIEISGKEGIVKLDVKLLEFKNNNDIIFLVYKLDDIEKIITIKFVGE